MTHVDSSTPTRPAKPSVHSPAREQILHHLYEAAELEHNLMCTYLYAAFSLKHGEAEGLSPIEAEATDRWRREILSIAIEEMGHLAAVWNITSALGGAPHMGRGNFPLDPGQLPARVVVKLAPFNAATVQHFVYLERPEGSEESDGAGFAVDSPFTRASVGPRITPMPCDYDTVGHFYDALAHMIQQFAAALGEEIAFNGRPEAQLGPEDLQLDGVGRVLCTKTALGALEHIVHQGEGAPDSSDRSHYLRFVAIREELARLVAANPDFVPAHPAATNPVLRKPPRPEGRVWLESGEAAETVDVANACYGLMLRLFSMAYQAPSPTPLKAILIDLGVGLMRAMTPLAEQAARLPAGPTHPGSNAGVSFTALRSAAHLPSGPSARAFIVERFDELVEGAQRLQSCVGGPRISLARELLVALRARAQRDLQFARDTAPPAAAAIESTETETETESPSERLQPITSTTVDGMEVVEGKRITLLYQGKRCIHARLCVTGAPSVFLANVSGPWIHPDAMPVERLVDVAHACPSGAIQYRRKDGEPDEAFPAVNLVSVREAGPYAIRGELRMQGEPTGTRLTLCRCGASRNKPYCDGSHHDIAFTASGEPETGLLGRPTAIPALRNGPIDIEPELHGPLKLRGPIEIVSGTGRMVCRVAQASLCRCGGSRTKPFCDGSHATNGFRSEPEASVRS